MRLKALLLMQHAGFVLNWSAGSSLEAKGVTERRRRERSSTLRDD